MTEAFGRNGLTIGHMWEEFISSSNSINFTFADCTASGVALLPIGGLRQGLALVLLLKVTRVKGKCLQNLLKTEIRRIFPNIIYYGFSNG